MVSINYSTNSVRQILSIFIITLIIKISHSKKYHSLRPRGTQNMGYIFLVKYIKVYFQQGTIPHTSINTNLHNLNHFYHILGTQHEGTSSTQIQFIRIT